MKKTILIPIFDGMIARNLLRTDVLAVLKKANVRVVLLPPKGKTEYYESEYGDGDSVVIEKTPIWQHTRWEFVVTGLFLQSIPTMFMKVRQHDWYWQKKKYIQYVGVSILRLLGHTVLWRRFLQWFESVQPIPQNLQEIYAKWKPDLVFAPTMIPRDEVALMKLAKKHGALAIGMVKSWDNLTSKAFLRFFPDAIVVHNEIVAGEAETIYNYPKEKTYLSGIPQFDEYAHQDFIEPKEKFYQKMGLDPAKKFFLYAPAGDWMNPHDKETVAMILQWIDEGKLPDVQVLLRLHPAYTSRTEELTGHPNLIVERPGQHFGNDLKAVEFDIDDIRHLASSIYHSSILINTASTMAIEAAIFDRPCVLIGFDGEARYNYWNSVIRYYDREHFVPIVRSGGAKLVINKEEFLKALKDYSENPSLDSEGRARIVREQCGPIDGQAGERIGKFLVSKLGF